jgi:hypothetical protein
MVYKIAKAHGISRQRAGSPARAGRWLSLRRGLGQAYHAATRPSIFSLSASQPDVADAHPGTALPPASA